MNDQDISRTNQVFGKIALVLSRGGASDASRPGVHGALISQSMPVCHGRYTN